MTAKSFDPFQRMRELNFAGDAYGVTLFTTAAPQTAIVGAVAGVSPEWIELQVDDESGEVDRGASLFVRRAEIYSIVIMLNELPD